MVKVISVCETPARTAITRCLASVLFALSPAEKRTCIVVLTFATSIVRGRGVRPRTPNDGKPRRHRTNCIGGLVITRGPSVRYMRSYNTPSRAFQNMRLKSVTFSECMHHPIFFISPRRLIRIPICPRRRILCVDAIAERVIAAAQHERRCRIETCLASLLAAEEQRHTTPAPQCTATSSRQSSTLDGAAHSKAALARWRHARRRCA